MTTFFVKRGYPNNVLKKAADSVSQIPRSETLKTVSKKSKDRVPLVLTYHPHNVAIRDILFRNFNSIVLKDHEMAEVFQSPPITAYRKGKSLRQHLVSSSYKSATKLTKYKGTRPCKRPICLTCPFTWETEEVQGPINNFTIKTGFTCITENVVYAIRCKRCLMLYIGETYRRLGDCFVEHKRSIYNEDDCPVGAHFRRPDHTEQDMQVTVLLQTGSGEKQRQFLEQRIINLLGTLRPRGMNAKKQFYT